MIAVAPMRRTSVVLFMPGLATCSRIGEDKLPDDVQEQYIDESRHVAENASSLASAMGSVRVASDCGANMVCICCHPRILLQSLR